MSTSFDKDAVRNETLALMALVDSGNVVQRAIEKRLMHLGLSIAQQRIIALVYLAEESLTPSMLAALLLQETQSVSGLLSRLEDRGLITRARDKKDRRLVWVGLTTEGRSLAEDAIGVILGASEELASVFLPEGSRDAVEAFREVRDLGIQITGLDRAVRREAMRRVWGEVRRATSD